MMLGAVVSILAMFADVTAQVALPRGTIVEPHMVSGDGADGIIGMATKRSIYAGKPVRMTDVEPPPLVTRQKPVTVLFRRNGLEMSTVGRSLQSAPHGDYVDVLLKGRRTPISAQVVSAGVVEVRN